MSGGRCLLCTSDRRAGSPIQQQTIWRSCTALVVSSCLYAGRGRRQYLAVPAAADRGQARESTQGLQAPRLRQPPWICNDVWPLPAAAAPALQLFDRRGRGMARGEAAAGIATAWLPGSGSVTSAGLHLRATCTESGALLPGAAHQQLGPSRQQSRAASWLSWQRQAPVRNGCSAKLQQKQTGGSETRFLFRRSRVRLQGACSVDLQHCSLQQSRLQLHGCLGGSLQQQHDSTFCPFDLSASRHVPVSVEVHSLTNRKSSSHEDTMSSHELHRWTGVLRQGGTTDRRLDSR